MNSLVKLGMGYDPFPSFENLTNRLWPADLLWRQDQVIEEEDHTVIRLDMPGIKEENLKVELKGSTLHILGTRNDRQEGRYAAFGQVGRSYSLPTGIEAKDIQADLQDGVLEIKIAKKKVEAVQIPLGGEKQIEAKKE